MQIKVNEKSTVIYDKEKIKHAIMKANEERLLQASNIPLRSNDLAILLGEQGDFDLWEKSIMSSKSTNGNGQQFENVVPRPEKLRMILLMDAQFNHNNKFIGK